MIKSNVDPFAPSTLGEVDPPTTTGRLINGENTCTVFEFPTAIKMWALSGVGAGHCRRTHQARTITGNLVWFVTKD